MSQLSRSLVLLSVISIATCLSIPALADTLHYKFDAKVTGTWQLLSFEVQDVDLNRVPGVDYSDFTLEELGLETTTWFPYADGDSWDVQVEVKSRPRETYATDISCIVKQTGRDLCPGSGGARRTLDGFEAEYGPTFNIGQLSVAGNSGESWFFDDDPSKSGSLPDGAFWQSDDGYFEFDYEITRWHVQDGVVLVPLPQSAALLLGALGFITAAQRLRRRKTSEPQL